MTIMQDDFLNKKLLTRLKKEFQAQQLEKTIDEIDYLNEIQNIVLSRVDLTPSQNEELEFLKKLNHARKNIQA